MPLKILATADIHIGRTASKLPSHVAAGQFCCRQAWTDIVECALKHSVDVVLLAGDVVDRKNRFFEAYGPLEAGIRKLSESNIDTLAVAGNHDHDVLPRLAQQVPEQRFRLLGAHGTWESYDVERDGKVVLQIHGWSFPEAHHLISPLNSYHLTCPDNVPTLGLLHADLDVHNSKYAPVSTQELQRTDTTIWVLGHVHAPKHYEHTVGPDILYPGSPLAMDPGEPGQHGPWLIEIDGDRPLTVTPLTGSPVRYETVPIDVSGIDDLETVEGQITNAVRERAAKLESEDQDVELVIQRLRITGHTSQCRGISQLEHKLPQDLVILGPEERLTAVIESVTNDTRPPIDLTSLADRTDLLGQLSSLILALDRPRHEDQDDLEQLMQDCLGQVERCYGASIYSSLDTDDRPAEDALRDQVKRLGIDLLETLRSQEQTS